MPALTQGYTFTAGNDGISGLDEVLMTEFDNVTAITVTSNVVTAMTLTTTKLFRRYILAKEMGMDECPMTNGNNGSQVYNHKIEFTTKGLTTLVLAEMSLVAQNYLMMIVKRRDGTYWLHGRTKGMELVSAGPNGVSKEAGGFKGSTWVFEGKEPAWAINVNSGIIAALLTAAP